MLIARFLLIFRALAPKNKKLRFFNEISIFLWHNLVIFFNLKKHHTKIKFREFFQKLQQNMAYNSYMGCRGTLKHFFEEFFTHFGENQLKIEISSKNFKKFSIWPKFMTDSQKYTNFILLHSSMPIFWIYTIRKLLVFTWIL